MPNIIVQSRSKLLEGAYIGVLLDSVRAAEGTVGRNPNWFIDQEPVSIKEAGSYGISGPHTPDPFQALVESFTQNNVWINIAGLIASQEGQEPFLASTSRSATLQSFPVEVELYCCSCIESLDFQANLEWGMNSLSKSSGRLSIRDEILMRAGATSVEGKLLPVSVYNGRECMLGGLKVANRRGDFFDGTIFIIFDGRFAGFSGDLTGAELRRRVDYTDKRERIFLESLIARVR